MSKRKANTKKVTAGKATVKSVSSKITDKDRKMAQVCVKCPVCRHARKKQKGAAFWFVKKIEGKLCPFCKAHERVYGRKAHQPIW
ncbi:MAG TPA: hypothetical protein DHO02_00190 [Syntrophaceae bacterium]|jgi:hypothetical protein|nr:hypothetical protein [Syntrophaceae bacterium]HCX00855.1 hypothetical protein [Syntrophaceae bacterium]